MGFTVIVLPNLLVTKPVPVPTAEIQMKDLVISDIRTLTRFEIDFDTGTVNWNDSRYRLWHRYCELKWLPLQTGWKHVTQSYIKTERSCSYTHLSIRFKNSVCFITKSGKKILRNDISTLASYDRHGSDLILSLQCNSWTFSLIIWDYKVCFWIFCNKFLTSHFKQLKPTFYSSIKTHYFCYLPSK